MLRSQSTARLGLIAAIALMAMFALSANVTRAAEPITIQNFAYSPGNFAAVAGDTITWNNLDTAPHTVTADGGQFNSGNIAQNGSFSFRFATAGTFAYHCDLHPAMTGVVTVSAAPAASATTPAPGGTAPAGAPATGNSLAAAEADGTRWITWTGVLLVLTAGATWVAKVRRA